jgi:hypothetical protein
MYSASGRLKRTPVIEGGTSVFWRLSLCLALLSCFVSFLFAERLSPCDSPLAMTSLETSLLIRVSDQLAFDKEPSPNDGDVVVRVVVLPDYSPGESNAAGEWAISIFEKRDKTAYVTLASAPRSIRGANSRLMRVKGEEGTWASGLVKKQVNVPIEFKTMPLAWDEAVHFRKEFEAAVRGSSFADDSKVILAVHATRYLFLVKSGGQMICAHVDALKADASPGSFISLAETLRNRVMAATASASASVPDMMK